MKTFLICLTIVGAMVWVSHRPKYPKGAVLAPEVPVVNRTPAKATKRAKIDYTTVARFIERHEGFRAKPYNDCVGVRTVGYGSLCKSSKPITKAEARLRLRARIQRDYDVLSKYVSRDTALVLCSFSYNVGLSHAVKVAKSRNLARMKYYVNAGGKKLAGLKKRRAQELAMLR